MPREAHTGIAYHETILSRFLTKISDEHTASDDPQPQTEPIQPNIPRWNLALWIAFRFWLVYLGLYCLATQIITSLFTVTAATGTTFPDPATLWPLRPVIYWTGAHIFHMNAPLGET